MEQKLKMCKGCQSLKYIWKSDKKDKYCKECWYKIEKPKSIAPVSEKRQVAMDEYSKKRLAFLAVHMNCQAKLVGCTRVATDIHHKAGRTGDNYLNMNTWLAVCRSCHSWIEINPDAAKELGFSENRLT